MASTEEWRRQFTKYKEDVKKRGKPFYPYAMFEDTIMSLVVVSVIIGLASVWYFTSGEDPKTCGDRKSTRLNSSHLVISYAVFCLKKKKDEGDGVLQAKPASPADVAPA